LEGGDLIRILGGHDRVYVDLADGRRKELTPRELEIAQLIAQGYNDIEIAARLGITPGTVKNTSVKSACGFE
jgi:DNA-binding NarL/FixJ family response regulator